MGYFYKCRDCAEAKATYRELSKKFHPDRGGNADDMKRLNAEYDDFIKDKGGTDQSYSHSYTKSSYTYDDIKNDFHKRYKEYEEQKRGYNDSQAHINNIFRLQAEVARLEGIQSRLSEENFKLRLDIERQSRHYQSLMSSEKLARKEAKDALRKFEALKKKTQGIINRDTEKKKSVKKAPTKKKVSSKKSKDGSDADKS